MPQGFLSASPTSRYGDSETNGATNYSEAQKYVLPGSGSITINEIGGYVSADAATTATFRWAIYTHDAANDCPETMVTNSLSDELSHNTTDFVKKSFTYSTKPVLTGGSTYWIAILYADGSLNNSCFQVDEESEYVLSSGGYPTWPTGTEWESASADNKDISFYAVYDTATEDNALRFVITLRSDGV